MEQQPAYLALVARVASYRAGWITRALYCVALLPVLAYCVPRAATWIGLAKAGGGEYEYTGAGAFVMITAGVIYRIYRVLRSADALDAGQPNGLGVLLRTSGWLLMLTGAIGEVALVLARPLTTVFFQDGQMAGIGYFGVEVYGSELASVGWLGCVMFEISRSLRK